MKMKDKYKANLVCCVCGAIGRQNLLAVGNDIFEYCSTPCHDVLLIAPMGYSSNPDLSREYCYLTTEFEKRQAGENAIKLKGQAMSDEERLDPPLMVLRQLYNIVAAPLAKAFKESIRV